MIAVRQRLEACAKAWDYFGARYYDSSLGRFLTPDWSAAPEVVPYANLANPQSLNLYSYALNNPTTATDPDGHLCIFGHSFLSSIGGSCGKTAPAPVKEGGPDSSLAGGLEAGLLGIRDAFTGKIPANASPDERNAASAAGMAMMVSGIGDAAGGEDLLKVGGELEEGASSLYADVTGRSALVKNVQTDLTRGQFESNLEAQGFTRSTSGDGKADVFTKDGDSYSVYTSSFTEGPSAQYTPAGAKHPTLKIRLGGGGN